jgi:acetyl-CoA decarbonylase/synthase complex subunit delta
MNFEAPLIKYSGEIHEVQLHGKEHSLATGGQNCYPFCLFEGNMPNAPLIAMEVYDSYPEHWPHTAIEPFSDVLHDPVKWAQKCVDQYGAQLICLQLEGTDPNGLNRSVEDTVELVKKLIDTIQVPLILWGTANQDKNSQIFSRIATTCNNRQIIMGPVEEANYKAIALSARDNGHVLIASSPIDINLAKQLNILLLNMNVPPECILIDPTVSSIGYGIEYCYSVMERIRIAALTQQDEKLQMPLICNIGRETWKIKEAKTPTDTLTGSGSQQQGAILFEAISAAVLLMAEPIF